MAYTNTNNVCVRYWLVMKLNFERLIVSIGIPLLVGGVSSYLAGDIGGVYAGLEQPPLSPPGWIFGVVWTLLYTLMGIASYLVITAVAPKKDVSDAIKLYGVQLAVNFVWPILFFRYEMYLFAFLWLALLLVLIGQTIQAFYRVSKPAAYLMIPYFLWVSFAGYLNLGLYLLNK